MEPLVIVFLATWVVVLAIKSQERYPEESPRDSRPPYQEPPHHPGRWEDDRNDPGSYPRDRRDSLREREGYPRRAQRHYRRRR